MLKRYRTCIIVMIGTLIIGTAVPTVTKATVFAEQSNSIVYKDVKINVISDNSDKRVVEETNIKTREVKTMTFDKLNETLTIKDKKGVVKYTKQDLINRAKDELNRNTMYRDSKYGGFWSIGYDYRANGDHYLKITKDGKVYEKTVRRTGYNASSLDAFKYTIDDLVGAEHSLFWSGGWTALGVLLSGGLGALAAISAGKGVMDQVNKIITLTHRAHSFYWRA